MKAVQLDTKLVLSWAPQFRRLGVGYNVSMPGLAGFVAAATALKEVELQCSDEGQAAEADVVFTESKSIQSMHISGARLPCILPLSQCRLVLRLDPFDEPGTRDHMADRVRVHAMLCRLMRLPCLETLILDMVDVTQLHSSAKLRCLGDLRIVMWMRGGYGGRYNLSWLKQQACIKLNIVVHIVNVELQQQDQFLAELQRLELELSSLKVYFCVPLPASKEYGSLSAPSHLREWRPSGARLPLLAPHWRALRMIAAAPLRWYRRSTFCRLLSPHAQSQVVQTGV